MKAYKKAKILTFKYGGSPKMNELFNYSTNWKSNGWSLEGMGSGYRNSVWVKEFSFSGGVRAEIGSRVASEFRVSAVGFNLYHNNSIQMFAEYGENRYHANLIFSSKESALPYYKWMIKNPW